MPVAAGEQVATMIQPFWLLPVLAIAKLDVRDVMGFTVVLSSSGWSCPASRSCSSRPWG
jgi:short-chain fatty acids transporter